jgi:hypothetical protein
MFRLREQWWSGAPTLNPEFAKRCSSEEKLYYDRYSRALNRYEEMSGFNLLSSGPPPKSVDLEIRVGRRSLGTIDTIQGIILFFFIIFILFVHLIYNRCRGVDSAQSTYCPSSGWHFRILFGRIHFFFLFRLPNR